MATPTRAECETQFGDAVRILNEVRKFGSKNTPNFNGMEDTVVVNLETDFNQEVLTSIQNVRSQIVAALDLGQAVLGSQLKTFGKFIGAPENSNADQLIARLYEDMVANAKTIKGRKFTFGSPVAGGGNYGNGTICRLTLDENGFPIDEITPDVRTIKCTKDDNGGAEIGAETFQFHGINPPNDALRIGEAEAGCGVISDVVGKTAKDSEAYVSNPSFSDWISGQASDWVVGTAWANFAQDLVNYYRPMPGDTAPSAIQFKANDLIYQDLTANGIAFDPAKPIYVQLAINVTPGACTGGTLTITFGNYSYAVNLALVGAGWQIITIPYPYPFAGAETKCWFKNFNKFPIQFKIQLAGLIGNYVLVDDIVLTPWDRYDGGFFVVVGGSTKFKYGDYFTITDTVPADEGKIAHSLWRYFTRHLPSKSDGSETWADPT